MFQKTKRAASVSMPRALCCAGIGVAAAFLLCALIAIPVYSGEMGEKTGLLLSRLCPLIGSGIGASLYCRKMEKGIIKAAAILSICILPVVLLLGGIVSKALPQRGTIMTQFALISAGSLCGSFLKMSKSNKKYKNVLVGRKRAER